MYVVLLFLAGLLTSVKSFDDEDKACDYADSLLDKHDFGDEDDDVLVWDTKKDEAIYDPLDEEGDEEGNQGGGEEDEH